MPALPSKGADDGLLRLELLRGETGYGIGLGSDNFVMKLLPGGPGEVAGLQRGDQIVMVDEHVLTPSDNIALLFRAATKLTVGVRRNAGGPTAALGVKMQTRDTRPPPPSPSLTAPAPAPAPAPALSSWFSGGSSLFGSSGGALLGSAARHLGEGAAFLSTHAAELSASVQLHAEALPAALPADGWAALDGVTSKLKATLDEQVAAYNREASLYCTDEAVGRERGELEHTIRAVGTTVANTVGIVPHHPAADQQPEPNGASEFVALKDAPPHLKSRLKDAFLSLSESESTFTTPAPELPALAHAAALCDEAAVVQAELVVLRAAAPAALAMDANLRVMRFKLVPARLKEELFWRNYCMRVLRERRIFQLPPLALPSDVGSSKDCVDAPSGQVESVAPEHTRQPDSVPAPSSHGEEPRSSAMRSLEPQEEAGAEADTWLLLAPTSSSTAGAMPTRLSRSSCATESPGVESSIPSSSRTPRSCAPASIASSVCTSSVESSSLRSSARTNSQAAGTAAPSFPKTSDANPVGTPKETSDPPDVGAQNDGQLSDSSARALATSTTPEQRDSGKQGVNRPHAFTPDELEAKIAAELGLEDDEDGELVSLELVDADELDAVLADDDSTGDEGA